MFKPDTMSGDRLAVKEKIKRAVYNTALSLI